MRIWGFPVTSGNYQSNQQSAISNQQSTISDQQSAIKNQESVYIKNEKEKNNQEDKKSKNCTFYPTNGWFNRFVECYQLHYYKMISEAGSSGKEKYTKELSELSDIISKFNLGYVSNIFGRNCTILQNATQFHI